MSGANMCVCLSVCVSTYMPILPISLTQIWLAQCNARLAVGYRAPCWPWSASHYTLLHPQMSPPHLLHSPLPPTIHDVQCNLSSATLGCSATRPLSSCGCMFVALWARAGTPVLVQARLRIAPSFTYLRSKKERPHFLENVITWKTGCFVQHKEQLTQIKGTFAQCGTAECICIHTNTLLLHFFPWKKIICTLFLEEIFFLQIAS